MARILSSICVLLLACPAWSDDKPTPNSLTPKEIADGWILLFDGESPFGWADTTGVKVDKDELIVGGGKPTHLTLPVTRFELRADFRNEAGIGATSLDLLWRDPRDGINTTTIFSGVGKESAWSSLRVKFDQDASEGGRSTRSTMKTEMQSGKPGFYENTTIFGKQEPAAIRLEIPAAAKLALRSIKLKPLGLSPLFNGKDLAGWKQYDAEPARAKSQFAVSKEGWLTLRNGGGMKSSALWA